MEIPYWLLMILGVKPLTPCVICLPFPCSHSSCQASLDSRHLPLTRQGSCLGSSCPLHSLPRDSTQNADSQTGLLPPAQPTSTPGFPASSYWPEMISWFLSLLSVSLASMYPTSPTRAGTVSPLSLDPQHPEGCLAPYASDLLKLYYQETEDLRSSFSMSYCAQFTISLFPTCLPSWGKLQPGTELRRGI